MRKTLSVILVLCFLFSICALPAYARVQDDDYSHKVPNPAKYTYISSMTTNLRIESGVAYLNASLSCNSGASSCRVTLYLQRREIGTVAWSTISTHSGTGVRSCSVGGSKTAARGYEYRAKAKFLANGSDGGSETAYGYSVNILYS